MAEPNYAVPDWLNAGATIPATILRSRALNDQEAATKFAQQQDAARLQMETGLNSLRQQQLEQGIQGVANRLVATKKYNDLVSSGASPYDAAVQSGIVQDHPQYWARFKQAQDKADALKGFLGSINPNANPTAPAPSATPKPINLSPEFLDGLKKITGDAGTSAPSAPAVPAPGQPAQPAQPAIPSGRSGLTLPQAVQGHMAGIPVGLLNRFVDPPFKPEIRSTPSGTWTNSPTGWALAAPAPTKASSKYHTYDIDHQVVGVDPNSGEAKVLYQSNRMSQRDAGKEKMLMGAVNDARKALNTARRNNVADDITSAKADYDSAMKELDAFYDGLEKRQSATPSATQSGGNGSADKTNPYKVGAVYSGMKYMGGDPNTETNWQKVVRPAQQPQGSGNRFRYENWQLVPAE